MGGQTLSCSTAGSDPSRPHGSKIPGECGALQVASAETTSSLVEFSHFLQARVRSLKNYLNLLNFRFTYYFSLFPANEENTLITDFRDCLFNANIVCFTE